MTEQKTAGSLDFEGWCRAVEDLNAERLASFYAEDVEHRFIGPGAPPSSPYVLRGKEELAELYRRAYQEDIRQRVEKEVMGEGCLACTVAAVYPDGKHELCAAFLELDEDGKITRQTIVEARDE